MTPVFFYFTVALIVFAVAQVALGAYAFKRAAWASKIARTERIRHKFAGARGDLVRLAAEDRISSKSVTFRELYFIQTYMMRHCDEYSEISHTMWRNALSNQKTENRLHKESATWNDETKAIVLTTADGLRAIWIQCLPFSTAITIMRTVLASVSVHLARNAEMFIKRALPGIAGVRDTEKFLRNQLAS
jgi:hypothetical protein